VARWLRKLISAIRYSQEMVIPTKPASRSVAIMVIGQVHKTLQVLNHIPFAPPLLILTQHDMDYINV
jgi:hypothetical protein